MKRMGLFFLSNLAMMLLLILYFISIDLFSRISAFSLHSLWSVFLMLALALLSAYCAFALSKYKARRSLVAKLIETPRNALECWLLATVAKQARLAGIPSPQVGIYESVGINAFATGLSRYQSMIAVSTGMLCFMPKEEAEAVLAHEISHLAHHDMVKLIAYQGGLNLGFIFVSLSVYSLLVLFFEPLSMVSLLIAMLVLSLYVFIVALLMHFSRLLEFSADQAGAKRSGLGAMIAALERLNNERWLPLPEKMAVLGMIGSIGSGVRRLFMSHPTLNERIAILKTLK
jgi:heat shock protein HtpX